MALAENVSIFPGITPNDFDANVILEAAASRGLTAALVIGWDAEGELFFSTSLSDGAESLCLIEKAKAALLGAVN